MRPHALGGLMNPIQSCKGAEAEHKCDLGYKGDRQQLDVGELRCLIYTSPRDSEVEASSQRGAW
jgi:hypothetical protein